MLSMDNMDLRPFPQGQKIHRMPSHPMYGSVPRNVGSFGGASDRLRPGVYYKNPWLIGWLAGWWSFTLSPWSLPHNPGMGL